MKLRDKEHGELEEIRKAIQIELESVKEDYYQKMRDTILSL